jgi:polysaccharide biosynthesis protein PelC
MKIMKVLTLVFLILLMVFSFACSYRQGYVKGDEIRSRARWTAVLPLVNLTSYPNAGRIVGELLTTELYAQTDFQLMEMTEMLQKLKGNQDDLDQVLDRAVALRVGKRLGVDTVIFGSVTEYRYKRGLDEDPVVGINIRMLDVKNDKILWAGSDSATGGCFWFCEDSLNRLAQKTCHNMVLTMVKN